MEMNYFVIYIPIKKLLRRIYVFHTVFCKDPTTARFVWMYIYIPSLFFYSVNICKLFTRKKKVNFIGLFHRWHVTICNYFRKDHLHNKITNCNKMSRNNGAGYHLVLAIVATAKVTVVRGSRLCFIVPLMP
jgi:hypothetical protein